MSRPSSLPLAVIASASEAIQDRKEALDCFVARAPRNDDQDVSSLPVCPEISSTADSTNMSDRPLAPKTQDYSVVPGSSGPRRDFRISVGLREGWDSEGRVFDVSEAVRTARAWMKRRVEAGLPALSGMFTRAEVTYAWPRADGTVGSDREPVALFTGEAVHAYLGHLPDETIEEMLNELSIELGAALGQERIYVAFADKTWILNAGEVSLVGGFSGQITSRSSS
jgi:hypothetical protein